MFDFITKNSIGVTDDVRCIIGIQNGTRILFVSGMSKCYTKGSTIDFIIWLQPPTEEERRSLYPVICQSKGVWQELYKG